MPKGYHHLTYDQRCQLYTLKRRGDSPTLIAKELGVNRSTIYREISRNCGKRGYHFKQAHEIAVKRRQKASKQPKKTVLETIAIIESKLRIQWSPEQITGLVEKKEEGKSVSHETIYQHIWKNKQNGGVLYKHLRRSSKKYNKRRSGKAGRGCIPNRKDITLASVDCRKEMSFRRLGN